MSQRILILCTGNSCRSQMAEGFLRSFDREIEVFSAGTRQAEKVNPYAIRVMNEVGIDLSGHYPKNVEGFLKDPFDYLITVCDDAKETCPVFTGNVKRRLHLGFPDPAEATGTEEEILSEFRQIRDGIKTTFTHFYIQSLKMELKNEK